MKTYMAFQMAWRLLTLVATRTETDRPDPSDAVGHQVGSWERKVKDCEQMAAQRVAVARPAVSCERHRRTHRVLVGGWNVRNEGFFVGDGVGGSCAVLMALKSYWKPLCKKAA